MSQITVRNRQIELQHDFIQYADVNNHLAKVRTEFVEFLNSASEAPSAEGLKLSQHAEVFRCTVPIDLLYVHEGSEALFLLLVNEPENALKIISDVVSCALRQEMSLVGQKTDISVQLCIKSTPKILLHDSTLRTISGVLVAKTFPTTYRRSSMWHCFDRNCKGSEGFRSLSLASCLECRGPVEENIAARDIGEVQMFKFLPLRAFQQNFGAFLPFMAELKDELLRGVNLELGIEYQLTGIQRSNTFEIWAMEPKHQTVQSPIRRELSLPSTLGELYMETRNNNPDSKWAFAAAIVSKVATDIFPASSFFNLKYGLLLSHASLRQSTPPVPVIAIGADTLAARKLLNSLDSIAQRSVHASGEYLCGVLNQDANNNIWADQGDLTAATHGVCNLGDWSKFTKRQRVHHAISSVETAQVVLENRSGLDLAPMALPLRSAVWSYWGHISRAEKDHQQLKTLINVFGLPFLADDSETENEEICAKILNERTSDESSRRTEMLSQHDLRQFMELICSQETSLTEAAVDLIRSYFVVSRRERPDCLPLSAVRLMTSLAEAHARISLRYLVLPEDVVVIIYLYEETISALFGQGINSPFSKLIWEQDEPIYSFFHRQMLHFTDWLQDYLEVPPLFVE